jgi:transposase-like protein
MRYPASEKAEIIRLVEGSHLPARRTLDKLGIPRATFYRWYDRYLTGEVEALADHRSRPGSRLEPHPRPDPGRDHRPGAARNGAEPTRAGGALHRREALLRLGSVGVSAAEERMT